MFLAHRSVHKSDALTAGEAHDNRLAGKLLSRLKSGSMLLADRGYDADWIRAMAARKGALANIPPRCNRAEPICFSPYLYRARNLGRTVLQRDQALSPGLEEGQVALEEALCVARRQQARAYELRAATSLARLWRGQGRREEARELITPVYGWFTEGFDTHDLKEAKTLLDELAVR